MNPQDDRLDILIGKLLDGEISPSERRTLDCQLEKDSRAREFLEQMRVLQECGREIIEHEVQRGETPPQEVFERAWQRSKRSVRLRIIRLGGWSRFAVGVAAGLLFGLALHWVPGGGFQSPMDLAGRELVARDTPVQPEGLRESWRGLQPRTGDQVTREVEWYGFTDPAGNHWLIEGYREGVVKPASYHSGL